MTRYWIIRALWLTAALCLLLSPLGWGWIAALGLAGFALLCHAWPPHAPAHADRAALNLDAPNVGYGSMSLRDDQGAWLDELESHGYIGGWASGACEPGPKTEVWPNHDGPWPFEDPAGLLSSDGAPAVEAGPGRAAPGPAPTWEPTPEQKAEYLAQDIDAAVTVAELKLALERHRDNELAIFRRLAR